MSIYDPPCDIKVTLTHGHIWVNKPTAELITHIVGQGRSRMLSVEYGLDKGFHPTESISINPMQVVSIE